MKTKTKIMSAMVLGASLLLTNQAANAQWLTTGNPAATNASKLGATAANVNLSLYAGNSIKLFLSGAATGNVGIGNVAPAAKLDVTGTIRSSSTITALGGVSTTWNFASRVAGAFTTSKLARWSGTALVSGVTFDNGVNVGIGNVAPAAKLHVTGTTRLQGATTIIGATAITGATTVTGALTSSGIVTSLGGNSTNWNLAFARVPVGTTSKVPRWNGTSYVAGTIFDNGTNVGVGTLTPATKLAVSGTQSLSGIATVGSFQIGENNTQNLVMDNNEVFSRFNGGASTLFLQYWGGDMSVCAGGGTTSFNGPINGQSASFGSDLLGYGNTVIDAGGNNIGSLNYGLTFGNASGEGISSKRDAGGNQFGLDFYTASANRMNISNAGLVNIVNDKTAQATTSANLQITSASAAPFYPAIGFSYLGDGNEIYSTTSAGGILVVKYDGSSYSPVTASAFNTVPAAASTTRNMQTIANTDFSTYLDQIRNVESVTYNNKNETAAMRSFPHIGFNAESLPGTIKSQVPVDGKVNAETTTGYNLTDLAGLTLIGVKAVDAKTQELEKQVNELKASVKDLENALASCCSNYSATRNGVDNSSATDKASLEQNNPNPFSSQTAIHYYLPSNSTAVLKVMSLEGQEMLSSTITKTGYGEVTISGSSLAAGTYTYTLLVNGKAVESKIMVLTK